MENFTQVRLVSVDNDHTMVGYFAGAVPAWREQLPVIAAKLGVSTKLVGRALGNVFARYGTHDYPWALALAKSLYLDWHGSVETFVEEVERPFWEAMDWYRLRYITPYRGVKEALGRLSDWGIPVVVVSDAPLFMCIARLVTAGLSRFISGVYALDCKRPALPSGVDPEWLRFGDERLATLTADYSNHGIKVVRELPATFEKPNPCGIQVALADFGVPPERCVHVGDSLLKDGLLAVNAGLRGFYHTPNHAIGNLPAEYLEWITEIVVPEFEVSASNKQTTPDCQPPMLGQGAFGDVLNHLNFTAGSMTRDLAAISSRLFRA